MAVFGRGAKRAAVRRLGDRTGVESPRMAVTSPGCSLPPRAARTDADGAGEPDEHSPREAPRGSDGYTAR